MTMRFRLTGSARKPLVKAVSEIIGSEAAYQGASTYAYRIGDYTIDREGNLTGPDSIRLRADLVERGFFVPDAAVSFDSAADVAPETTPVKGKGIMDTLVDTLNENAGEGEQWTRLHSTPKMECGDGRWRNLDGTFATDAATVADVAPETASTDDIAPANDDAQDANDAPNAAKADKRDLPRLYTLDTPRGEIFIAEEFATRAEALAEGYGEYFTTALGTVYSYNDDRTFALVTSSRAGDWDTTKIKRDFRDPPPAFSATVAAMMEPMPEAPPAETPDDDQVVIEYPLDGFDPAKLENLRRLVDNKGTLIRKALRADDLPIHIEGDRLVFPWFKGNLDGDSVNAYAQFIAALCETAKKKTRVVAKDNDDYENERFAMRLFTVALGLIGPEFSLIRKLLTKPMNGNGAWRYGDPKKKAPSVEDVTNAAYEAIVEAIAEVGDPPETAPEARASAIIEMAVVALEENLAENAE